MNKVLVVHTGGGLGDVLLSTAVVSALHARGATVDFLCQRRTLPALQGHPQVRRTWVWPEPRPGGLAATWQWARQLRAEGYDAALVLWSNTGVAWTCFLAGIPVRVGQDSRLAYSFLYTHKVRVRSEHGDQHSHWTEILLDYVRALGWEVGPAEVRLHIPPAAWERAQALLQPLAGEGPLVALHPFKGPPVSLQRWPLPVFASWARRLHDDLNARVVITGGPSEAEAAAAIADMSGCPRMLCLAGSTDVPTLGALAAACDLFVCPDSGPMHVAAAAGARVLGVYALEEDYPLRWAPFSDRARTLRPQPTGCRPGCRKAECPDFRCYRGVSEESLLELARELLSSGEGSSLSPGDAGRGDTPATAVP